MKKEQIIHAMGCIDHDLIEGADNTRAKTRMRPAVRAGLIAACLCVALVGTVFAVEHISGIPLFRPFTSESLVAGEPVTGFYAVIEPAENGYETSVVKQECEVFSGDVLALASDVGDGTVSLSFGSWEEAEAYLALDLMDNAVLVSAEPGSIYISEDHGVTINETGCEVSLSAISGELTAVRTTAAYFMNPVTVNETNSVPVRVGVFANVYTVHSPIDSEDVFPRYAFSEEYTITSETYTTPNGLTALIVEVCDEEYGSITYYAQFAWNGAAFTVDATFNPDPSHALSTLKEVLDAFEF